MIPIRDQALAAIQDRLKPHEVVHCVRTEELAIEIATSHGIDPDKASIGGLLHDYCRALPHKVLLSEARRLRLEITDIDQAVPYLLHGPVAARTIPDDLPLDDLDVLHAIDSHTLGAAPMSELAAVVFLADHLESGRAGQYVAETRLRAKEDLWGAALDVMQEVIARVTGDSRLIHPRTVASWNHLVRIQP